MSLRCEYCNSSLLYKKNVDDNKIFLCKKCGNVYIVNKGNIEILEKGLISIQYDNFIKAKKISYCIILTLFILALFFLKFNVYTFSLFLFINIFIFISVPNILIRLKKFKKIDKVMKINNTLIPIEITFTISFIITIIISLFISAIICICLDNSSMYVERQRDLCETKILDTLYIKNSDKFYLAKVKETDIDYYYYFIKDDEKCSKQKVVDVSKIIYTDNMPKLTINKKVIERRYETHNVFNKFFNETTSDWEKYKTIKEEVNFYIPKNTICTGITEGVILDQKNKIKREEDN